MNKTEDLRKVLKMCLEWYEEAPTEEIEAVERAISKNFPAKEIIEVLKIGCYHSFIDKDNNGVYGIQICRFCGTEEQK